MFTVAGHLNFNSAAKTATFVDDTDLSVLNLAQVQVTGTATINGPDGVAIATGLTIDRSAGDTATTSFNLPLDNSLAILNGTYTFTYVLNFVVNGFSVAQFTATDTITISGVDWADIFNYTAAANDIIIAGATTPGNDGTYGVGSATLNAGDTDFVVTGGTVTTEAGGAATIDFDVTYPTFSGSHTFTGCDEVTITVDTPYACNTTPNGQIIFEDTTVLPTGQTLVSDQWTISYPNGLTNPATPADIVTTGTSVTVSNLATGQWSYIRVLNISVTQADGLVYTYTATKSANVDVDCVTTLCQLACGIWKIHQQYALALNGGAGLNALTKFVALVNAYYIDAKLAMECGDQAKFDEYAALILAQLNLAGVNCDCGCDDSTDEGNHWVNNTGQAINTAFAQQTLFETTTPIAATAGINPDDSSILPISTFGTVTIPTTYFQFASELTVLGLLYGKKFINIEYKAFNSEASFPTTELAITGQTVLAAFGIVQNDLADATVKIGTRKSGNDTIFTVQSTIKKMNSGTGVCDFQNNYFEFTNLIDILTPLSVVHTFGGGGAADLVIYDVKIYPSQQI